MTAIRSQGSRPVIGLSTYREQAAWTVWQMPADLLPSVYTRSVEAAGATVVLLPPQTDGAAQLDPTLEAIFSDLLPVSSYEDAFAALTQTAPQYPNPLFSATVRPGPAQPSQAAGPADPSLAPTEAPMWASEPGGSSCVPLELFVRLLF